MEISRGLVGSLIVRGPGIAPEAGLFAMVFVAGAGAAGRVVVEREVRLHDSVRGVNLRADSPFQETGSRAGMGNALREEDQ